MYTIENEFLKVDVLQKGAELRSLLDKRNDFEWMWQADQKIWGKSSPVLFPIVGALRENRFVYANQSYSLSRHGFARDRNFQILEESPYKLVFVLESNDETKLNFPFDFNLFVSYELLIDKLTVSYEVHNRSDSAIYFSLGAHPAFNIANTVSADAFIEFPRDEFLERYYLNNNLLSIDCDIVFLNKNRLSLDKGIFDQDAWIIKSMKSKEVDLQLYGLNRKLRFSFENFPFFGIWSVSGAPFVCLEPWAGLPDVDDHNFKLEDKEGIRSLNIGETWSAQWSAQLF